MLAAVPTVVPVPSAVLVVGPYFELHILRRISIIQIVLGALAVIPVISILVRQNDGDLRNDVDSEGLTRTAIVSAINMFFLILTGALGFNTVTRCMKNDTRVLPERFLALLILNCLLAIYSIISCFVFLTVLIRSSMAGSEAVATRIRLQGGDINTSRVNGVYAILITVCVIGLIVEIMLTIICIMAANISRMNRKIVKSFRP